MNHHLQASPDQVLAITGGIAGGVIVALVGWAAWTLHGSRHERRRRRAIGRDLRLLERGRP